MIVPDGAATLAALRLLAEDQPVDVATFEERARLRVEPATLVPHHEVRRYLQYDPMPPI